jgi:hypothetical protein
MVETSQTGMRCESLTWILDRWRSSSRRVFVHRECDRRESNRDNPAQVA